MKPALQAHTKDNLMLAAAAMLILLAMAGIILLMHYPESGSSSAAYRKEMGLTDYKNNGFLYVPDSVDEMLLMEAQNIVSAMSDEVKVGQLLLIRSNGMDTAEFAALAAECHAGGVVLFGEDVENHTAESLKSSIASLQSAAGGRLLVCVDEEGGTVVRLSGNENLRSSRFRSPQALYAVGGMDAVRSDTAEKCDFLRGFGINVNFAPVADVVTSPTGFLYKRAFGRGGEATAEYVYEVVSVMEQYGMGSTVKHFPGYGNSAGDTHNGLVVVDTSEEDIRQRELLPFVSGIAAGADSVMVTHTVISSIDPDRPATLSPAVISLLRSDLGFGGVIISDAMDMGAITEYTGGKDACVAGFLAGLDMLCTPGDTREAYNALLTAVQDGTISAERLDESVIRIVLWKMELGLYDISG